MHIIGVVMGQHPTRFIHNIKSIFHSNRRVLYPYNTFLIQTHQTIFDFYPMPIHGVVVEQHPTL